MRGRWLLVGIAVVMLAVSWRYWAFLVVPPPVEFRDKPWRVLNDAHTIHSGESLRIIAERCGRPQPWTPDAPNLDAPPLRGEVTRYWRNVDSGQVGQWDGGPVDIFVGCLAVPFALGYAASLPPGHYVIYGSVFLDGYYPIQVPWSTEIFTVIP